MSDLRAALRRHGLHERDLPVIDGEAQQEVAGVLSGLERLIKASRDQSVRITININVCQGGGATQTVKS